LQLAPQACSLVPSLASLAFVLQVWPEPVPQVSPALAKLALPESAPPALREAAHPVLKQWACPAWQVAAPFGRPDRLRDFR